ncbi:protein of unknown function DUF4101 [Macleaya cordata]|uniref:Uncharacterized protein n=1 Tax=Macleaya cordata TaxID=56857 RepID=A0A200R7X7_MACCD|nr:protein of unknown function DUF4101 [Macleaya cordata]
MSTSPACCYCYFDEQRNSRLRVLVSLSGTGNIIYRVPGGFSPLGLRYRRRRREISVEGRGRLNVTELQNNVENNGQIRNGVEIPVTCFQIIGVPDRAEKDEIVKSVMDLKSADVEEGYTLDAVVSRQELLMDVRDKLLFEPEYAGNVREKVPPKSPLRIPWSWLPGALCLLQEVGEEKLVLEIGRAALQHPDAKPYIHDLLLSMALAECAIAKIGFEKNKVSQGFEALARAQYLLRSKISLGKMPLLSQIEESLEELAPACTLELLGMPHTPENAERRRGAISALRELLRQGLDVESSCRVQDWPCFLSQALIKLMATEIIDLLPWDDLAVIRKNKKSLESQNQRVVIDFNCFYMAMIAHVAVGFSSKQTELITKAKTICECLVASEGIDLKFEEALFSFLLGQGGEEAAAERLRELEINSGLPSRNIVSAVSENETKNGSSANQSLEIWLKDAVLGLFPDTRDCSPSLANFFGGEKRTLRGSKQNKGPPKIVQTSNHRPSSFALSSDRGGSEDPLTHLNSTRHLGVAVKQLAPADLQSPLMAGKTSTVSGTSSPSVQLKRNLGTHHKNIWGGWSFLVDVVGRITFVTVIGCFVFTTLKLCRWDSTNPKMDKNTLSWTMGPSLDHKVGPACINRSNIGGRLRKLLVMFKNPKHHPDDETMRSSSHVDDLLPFTKALHKRQMPVEEAESLVKQWQAIKAEALGPDHEVQSLSEVLAESMLAQWRALADSAKAKSCFWRFVLLQLSVLRAEILSDGMGGEMAEIEALLEEAAELVDESQTKNPNYYSSYRIRYILKRQYDGSWRFCSWGIQTPT